MPPPPLAGAIKRLPMARREFASRGQSIELLTNHFKVTVLKMEDYFFHYNVAIKYKDDSPVDVEAVGRRMLDKVYETYRTELDGKRFAYDGEKSLFTVGALPQNNFEFTVNLEDISSNRSGIPGDDCGGSKTYKVEINYAARIPMQAIADALNGRDSEHSQEAVRVLNIMLRQHAAKQGCLLVDQTYFHNEPKNFVELKGGVLGCRGFHSSFRAMQGGLLLNMGKLLSSFLALNGPLLL